MKNFDARWQRIADWARDAGRQAEHEQAPLGFSTRVAARALRSTPLIPPAAFEWDRLLTRFLTGASATLVLCAAMEWRHLKDSQPLEPGIENAVAELVWSL